MQETPNHRGSSTTMIVVAAGALLLIFVAIAASIYLPYRHERQVEQTVRALGGYVVSDYRGPKAIPESLRGRIPIWDRILRVHLTSTPVTDSDLILRRDQIHLKQLELGFTRISDAGLERLKGMTSLELIDLRGTAITDAGLVHLK